MVYLFRKAKTPEELAAICKTPDRLAWWVHWNLRYKDDKAYYRVKEYFATPEEILKNGCGDCEDYAWLAHDTLRLMGFQDVYIIDVKKSATLVHAVCAFRNKEGWYIFGTEGLHKCTGAQMLNDIPDWVAPGWRYWTEYHIFGMKLKAKKRHYRGVEL